MKEEHKTNNFNNTQNNTKDNILENEQTKNFMRFFFTYDYMKFQQLIKATNSAKSNRNFTEGNKFTTCKSNIDKEHIRANASRNRNFNSTIRFMNRKTKRQRLNRSNNYNNNYAAYYHNNNTRSNNLFHPIYFRTGNMNINSSNKSSKSNSIKDDLYSNTHNLYGIEDDIREIKNSQKETDIKLDLLIKHLIPNTKTSSNNFDNTGNTGNNVFLNHNNDNNDNINIVSNFSSSYVKYSFGFELHGNGNNTNNINNLSNHRLSSEHQQLYDYFSFKIKPDLTLSMNGTTDLRNSTERKSLASRKNKGASPDRLISHKFFEDSENFRNTNLMSVKTFMNNNNTAQNPFCMTDKSVGIDHLEGMDHLEGNNLANIFSSDTKLDNDNEELDIDNLNSRKKLRKLTNLTSENNKNADKEDNAYPYNASNTHTDRENSFNCLKDDMSSIANYSERDIDININTHSTDKKANTMNNKSEVFNSIKINNFHISEEESNTSLRSNNTTNKIEEINQIKSLGHDLNENEIGIITNNIIKRNSKLNKENTGINNCNSGNGNKSNSSNKLITASERDNIMNTLNTISISVNNDSVSMSSSKMNVEGSNDKFNKKVRGFNFKNNINTKKFTKPLLTSQMSNVDSNMSNPLIVSSNNTAGGLIHNKLIDSSSNNNSAQKEDRFNQNLNNIVNNFSNVNKSSNLEDKLKIKKFNFNNNINIKKFIRNDMSGLGLINNSNVLKEREKQYAVEIEESDLVNEGNGISISDLTDK
jgi:hypothetical protein